MSEKNWKYGTERERFIVLFYTETYATKLQLGKSREGAEVFNVSNGESAEPLHTHQLTPQPTEHIYLILQFITQRGGFHSFVTNICYEYIVKNVYTRIYCYEEWISLIFYK